jgi:hypothetical protein
MALHRQQMMTIQTAKRWLEKHRGMTDAAYRTLLRSVAKVESSKDLDNAGFEQCMAVLEAQGFQSHPRGPTYWRDKAADGGGRSSWKILTLAAESRYELASLCLRFSDGRTERSEDLTPQEAHRLTEMLKQSNAREVAHGEVAVRRTNSSPAARRTPRKEAAGLLFPPLKVVAEEEVPF